MSRTGKTGEKPGKEENAGGDRRRIAGLVRWLPAVSWMAAIFWMSSRTGSEIGSMFPFARYLPPWMGGLDFGHLVAYFVLGLFVLWGFGNLNASAKWFTVGICTLYGATDEFHQLFVDGRSAEWHDLANDAIGACLAMLVVSLPPIRRRLAMLEQRRRRNRPMG